MEAIRTKQWQIHLLTSWGQPHCKIRISCHETYQAFPFPVWVGGESLGVKLGVGANTSKGSNNSIWSQSVATTVTVISRNLTTAAEPWPHPNSWTMMLNHLPMKFTRCLSKCLNSIYAPWNSPGCTECLSHDACWTTDNIRYTSFSNHDVWTTEIHQMHGILSHNTWTTYHRVHPGVQNSQAMTVVNELYTTGIIRLTEFPATMFEVYTTEFHLTYGNS